MASIELKVPDIGDFDEVSVIELLVKPGDTVKHEQSLVTVESDKASMEIPSSAAGVVKEMKVKLGDKVKEGSVLLVLEGAETAASPSPQPSPASGRGSYAAVTASPEKTFPGRGPGSSFRWQAEKRPGAISFSAGRSTRQRSKAKGQRGWKWQPGGGRSGEGISPLSAENFFFFASSRGTSSRSACV
jgi:pyruvate/2-oxoglutarate dehydrogenase complex dihydrolipoamide acyltransferase (E2) component